MNDRSATTTCGGGATRAGSSVRTFTRSSTVTRSSVRSDQASWPYPTSAATTCAAPARSSTSVKPPVDAPASRQRLPATSRPENAASAPASLCPPRDTYCGPASASSATVTAASLATWVAGLAATWPPIATRPAAISSAACSRDLASPRRTSSASSLPRAVTAAVLRLRSPCVPLGRLWPAQRHTGAGSRAPAQACGRRGQTAGPVGPGLGGPGRGTVPAPSSSCSPGAWPPGSPGRAGTAGPGLPGSPSSPRISRSRSWTPSRTAGRSARSTSSSEARPPMAASTRGSPVGAREGRDRCESMIFNLLRCPGHPIGHAVRYPPA